MYILHLALKIVWTRQVIEQQLPGVRVVVERLQPEQVRAAVVQLALDLPVVARVGVVGRQMGDERTSFVDVLADLGDAGRRQHVDDDVGSVVVHVLHHDRHLPVVIVARKRIIYFG